MTVGGRLGRSPRKLALLLLVVAVPPAATLVWLGFQLLQQDRSLLAQRDLERRQAALQAVVHSLQLSLADAERYLSNGRIPDGMVRLTLTQSGMRAEPANGVLWLPGPADASATDDARFADAERVEFQGDADKAAAEYRAAARSQDVALRAGGLMRLARVRRSQQRWTDALSAYEQLSHIDDAVIAGAPASLQARRAICDLLEALGRPEELSRSAGALEADLIAGRWVLDRPAWELTAAQLERWTGHALSVPVERRGFSAVADALWNDRQRGSSRRRVVVAESTPMTIVWEQEADTKALAVSRSALTRWFEQAMRSSIIHGGQLTLLGPDGEQIAGTASAPADASVVKAASTETGLPWSVVLSTDDGAFDADELGNRRRLLSAGLGAILLLIAGGSYFLWRVVQRELAVGRLQTDFVAAVSHEFRTPLTSLRHVSELLSEDDDVPRVRRQALYGALGRNTERLHRLVESLLDFARMEGGRRPYRLEPASPVRLVTQVVGDFQQEIASRGITVALTVDGGGDVEVLADLPSLTNAIWNLLDNAVKYSPGKSRVEVTVATHGDSVAISVRDEGLGVPIREQKEIFHRFVRGEAASQFGIKGTGLGLAMVSHIVEAHGGSIELRSQEGIGSTFTVVLPFLSLES